MVGAGYGSGDKYKSVKQRSRLVQGPKGRNQDNKTHTRQGHAVDHRRGGGKAQQGLGLNRNLRRNRDAAKGSRPFADAG